MKLFDVAVRMLDLDVAIDQHAPRVQFFPVIHYNGVRFFDDGKHHDGAEGSSHSQSHISESFEVLGQFQQNLDVLVGSLGRILLQTFSDMISNR